MGFRFLEIGVERGGLSGGTSSISRRVVFAVLVFRGMDPQLYRSMREFFFLCIVKFGVKPRHSLLDEGRSDLNGFDSNAQHTHTKRTPSAHQAQGACAFCVCLVCVSSCFQVSLIRS
jgi:hypothetical protein